MTTIKKLITFYTFWVCTHYAASHMYTKVCTPLSLYGFLFSPFIASAPHCTALLWFVSTGSGHVHTMWVIIGAWGVDYLKIY